MSHDTCDMAMPNDMWQVLFTAVLWLLWRNQNLLVFGPDNAGRVSVLSASKRIVEDLKLAMESKLALSPAYLLAHHTASEGSNLVVDRLAKVGYEVEF
ncbi:hypothetical protein V6N13_004830 [Hibiscus sabdariffa]